MLKRSWKAACVVIALGVVGALWASLAYSAPRKSGVKPKVGAKTTAEVVIHIQNHTFLTPASIRPGATVQWVNDDLDSPHTASSDDGAPFFFDTMDIATGGGVSKVVTMPSTNMQIGYHCNIHGCMTSTLNVGNAPAKKHVPAVKKPKKR
jgi:plastocyanin